MVRKPDHVDYRKMPCYLIRQGGQKKLFWADEKSKNEISTNIGQQVSDGHKFLVTQSDLVFRINDQVQIGEDKLLTVEAIDTKLDELDNNVMRGKPRYIKTLFVR